MADEPSGAKAPHQKHLESTRLKSERAVTEHPLAGRRVLVTRARHQAGALAHRLRALGAEVLEIPAIEIAPPESFAPLDTALHDLSPYQWLIVTSANGARALSERMGAAGTGPAAFSHLRIAAVGSATAQALREMGLKIAVMPREYVAESLLEALGDQAGSQRVLLARAAVARDVIPDALRAQGATVDVVDAYRTVVPADSVAQMRTILGHTGGPPDAATFTSSSTVTNFLQVLQKAGVAPPKSMRAISIGPITSQTLRDHGWEPAAEADPHDLNGLLQAVVDALA
jgi:uroporphyrinogen-III synthase